jgi:hypothetical protein
MRKCANMYIFPHIWGGVSHIWLCNCSTLNNFLIYEENLIFFFNSAAPPGGEMWLVVSWINLRRYWSFSSKITMWLARICKCLWSPGIESEESISLTYVAWRAGTKNSVVVPARQAGNRFLVSLKALQIRALFSDSCGLIVQIVLHAVQ